MIRSPYVEDALKQHFRVGDSGKWQVDVEKNIDAIVASAANRAASAPPNLAISNKIDKSGKTIYFAADIETDLILRATYRRLRKQCGISLPNREDILNGIIEATSEATPYLVSKCDIKSFYERLDAELIVRQLLVDTRTNPSVKAVLRQIYVAGSIPRNVAPRGLALSAVLAEIALRRFDQIIRKTHGVHRYFRYADDMIIFSLPNVEIIPIIKRELGEIGLELNEKTETCSVDALMKLKPTEIIPVSKYTYLGYEIAAQGKVSKYASRQFDISIAEAKLKKRKTRLFLSLHAFVRDGDEKLLIDRINYLSANQSVYKTRHTRGARKQKIRTGIHYNYSRCGHYPASKNGRTFRDHNAHELVALDVVLKNALFGSNSEFSSKVSILPPGAKAELAAISFAQGFKKKIIKRYTRARVGQICKVWGHE
ncbi:antiviral reverse transcriptase Drt3a [Rhodobacter sp. 24-YEA-8]|uniref:antiviral reverse transcriptase Drt3a n=1 Tax=Rhodobacter sp. 24-YEA-8 TaxID=1884310 RepID=UPI00089DA5F9|nr:antiviral reverse transcriptase Drt3a [Rhodobacter sp. 24-YEA-8]SEB47759.1 Reverse transcriptase (RNA-dependent DNA polymerase) [Rhodobacter sp. 24-YEA-8]